MASGSGSSGAGRGRGTPSLNDNKSGESKDSKPNPKMSKALSTSAKRFVHSVWFFRSSFVVC